MLKTRDIRIPGELKVKITKKKTYEYLANVEDS